MYKLSVLINALGGELHGDDVEISAISSLDSAAKGCLSFCLGNKFLKQAQTCQASALVLKKFEPQLQCSQIIIKDPQLFIARALSLLHPAPKSNGKIHPSAVIADDVLIEPSAEIGPLVVIESGACIGGNTIIQAGSVIGPNVKIGSHCLLHARVVVYADTEIADYVEIHSGAVIGSDGFGNAWAGQGWEKIPQIGKVQIGSHVEIGANTTIDRGALDNTVIADGVRLDNQIQVAHNVTIGAHTAIAACTGIAGSTNIGANCLIGGGVLIAGHINIADRITLLAGNGVPSSLTEAGVYASGVPVMPYASWARNVLQFRRLDEMTKRVKKIEKQCLVNESEQ
ncbi:UDP-3-O-(3-hydroxymyristoyl)glucosamine N-acyltransferase [Deefgea salmonis]|uniref:UDP-3-O-acylglucosamine N-acyltransferase n=1 Tax=Deefgea salmonis TaxID=2875502 RepID=A0ABS8BGU3_9NEIS|nr:UDP-3-O-(3-hydroxymyristoyl)glucosamine N-acyltransferase [Deefgea salmonis]MCB5194836.1 UDP-3-O-(3-hydroxymyristoyl)glucosamine N-acyltransferase [Deefgea salmonis]